METSKPVHQEKHTMDLFAFGIYFKTMNFQFRLIDYTYITETFLRR